MIGQHDITLFRNGKLITSFVDENTGAPLKAGLADRGYWSSDLLPHLWTGIKKRKNGVLTDHQKKLNNILSTLRIEVERAIGRLKQLERLNVPFRSSLSSFDAKLRRYRKIFNVCIHFTNVWIDFYPLRRKPHWLLCIGRLDSQPVRRLLQAYFASPAGTKLSNFAKTYEGGAICDGLDQENDESSDSEASSDDEAAEP